MHRPPPLPESVPRWRARAAPLTHGAFYFLLIAMPLTGWLRTSPGRYPLRWFGLVDIPKFPIAPDTPEAALAAQSHAWLGWALLALAALHVAAALHHHFRLRDALLLRMLPARGR